MALERLSPAAATPAGNAPLLLANVPSDSVEIRPGETSELGSLMEIVTQDLSLGRRHLVYATLGNVVARGDVEAVASVVAYRNGRLVAGAVAMPIAEDAAQFLGVGCDSTVPLGGHQGLERSLVDALHRLLRNRGYRFIQASCEAGDRKPKCASAGYEWIATLEYLQAEVTGLLAEAKSPPTRDRSESWQAAGLECRAIDPSVSKATRGRIVALVESTYRETLDCPRLNRFRTAADVVTGYATAPTFDSSGWRIISDGGGDAACLMTTRHPAAESVELTYMGVAPSYRGRGIGRLLVREAARLGQTKGAKTVVLAVDQENLPARAIYTELGFEPIGGEAVWGQKIAPSARR